MSAKIFVGNLPFSVGDKDLNELFASYGEISEASVIKDKYSGRSKGFGFVTFTDQSASQKAITEMNGKDVQGRAINVSEAKPINTNNKPHRREFRRRF